MENSDNKPEFGPIIAAMLLFVLFAAMFTFFMEDEPSAKNDVRCIGSVDSCEGIEPQWVNSKP